MAISIPNRLSLLKFDLVQISYFRGINSYRRRFRLVIRLGLDRPEVKLNAGEVCNYSIELRYKRGEVSNVWV